MEKKLDPTGHYWEVDWTSCKSITAVPSRIRSNYFQRIKKLSDCWKNGFQARPHWSLLNRETHRVLSLARRPTTTFLIRLDTNCSFLFWLSFVGAHRTELITCYVVRLKNENDGLGNFGPNWLLLKFNIDTRCLPSIERSLWDIPA